MFIKKLSFFILFLIILTACNQQEQEQETSTISFDEVKSVITEQGLELEDANFPAGNIFIQELNGVSPKVFTLDGIILSIYVFSSVEAREKGMKAFEDMTAAASVEEHETYIVKNVLIFYGEGKQEIKSKLELAFERLGKD